jgi:branched-subunit amino acid transport protein
MNEFILILGMALVTFAVRYPVLALVGRAPLPELVMRALRYVPVAVLTAITVPELLYRDGSLSLSLNNAQLVAGIATIVIAWRTKNLLLTIGLGMTIFLGWRAFVG